MENYYKMNKIRVSGSITYQLLRAEVHLDYERLVFSIYIIIFICSSRQRSATTSAELWSPVSAGNQRGDSHFLCYKNHHNGVCFNFFLSQRRPWSVLLSHLRTYKPRTRSRAISTIKTKYSFVKWDAGPHIKVSVLHDKIHALSQYAHVYNYYVKINSPIT